MDRDQIRDNETASCMTISISTGFPDFEQDINIFSVDTDAQKVAAMDWLTDYLDEKCEGWSIGYYHGADGECLCYNDAFLQSHVDDKVTRFAIPIHLEAGYLAFYDKVATKSLSDPEQWHPIVEHLPEMMSIDVGVMYR